MSFDSFVFVLKNAVHNIFKNSVLTVASIVVLCICLLSLGSTILLVNNVDMIVDSVGSENQIVIFLEEDLPQDKIEAVGKELNKIKNVTNVVYETPEKSLENYSAQLGQSAVEGLDASVFRPSYIVELVDLNKYEQTVYDITKIEGIGLFESGEHIGQPAIRSSKELVDKIVQVKEIMSFFSVVIIGIFLVLSLFIIKNVVKLSVYSRKTEINIMKYVGATDFFIQLPYFVEGLLVGLFSGIVAFFVQRMVYTSFISPVMSDLIDGAELLNFDSYFGIIFALFTVIGSLVGILGSVFSVKKHLDV